jgi:phage/plasmid-like protein (TIGR03299 family)
MAADILGEMYAGVQSAWHKLGIVDPTLVTSRAAIAVGGMDYQIYKQPLMATAPDGTSIEVPLFGLMREPVAADYAWRMLGTCGGEYDFWQNRDVADRVDQLIDETGWKFAAAGVLKNGATIFICLEMPGYNVKGDPIARFFVYNETRDGKTRSAAIVSDMRVVCSNTLDAATRRASGLVKIKHHSDYKTDADWTMNIIAEANKSGNSVTEAMNALAEVQMTDDLFTDMLDACVPMPKMPNLMTMPNLSGRMKEKRDAAEYVYTMKLATASKVRDQIIKNYNTNTDIPANLVNTGWSAYQAVTHYTTHQHGTLGQRGKKMSSMARAEYDVMGDGVVMRNAAYDALTNGGEVF